MITNGTSNSGVGAQKGLFNREFPKLWSKSWKTESLLITKAEGEQYCKECITEDESGCTFTLVIAPIAEGIL